MAQLHNKFTDTQVRELIEWYLAKKIGRKYVQEILGIKKTRFFALVQKVRIHPGKFSILYTRNTPTHRISEEVEGYIVKELEKKYEWQRQLLGQCRNGELLPYLGSRINLPESLSNKKRSPSGYF